jgi:hypothetical protein
LQSDTRAEESERASATPAVKSRDSGAGGKAFVTMWLRFEDPIPAHAIIPPARVSHRHDPPFRASRLSDQNAGNYSSIGNLAQSLLDVDSPFPLVVLVSSNFSGLASAVSTYPNIVLHVLDPLEYIQPKCKQFEGVPRGYHLSYQKLQIFQMDQYDRLIWLDSDLLINENIDHLFDLPTHDGATIYGQQWDSQCVGCPAPEKMLKKDHSNRLCHGYNSFCGGLIMLQPSKQLFNKIEEAATDRHMCWGEDDVINYLLNDDKRKWGIQKVLFNQSDICFAKCAQTQHCKVVHDSWFA